MDDPLKRATDSAFHGLLTIIVAAVMVICVWVGFLLLAGGIQTLWAAIK